MITRIIVDDIEKGQFSVTRFYERRIRRIFPALFAVLLVTTIFVYLIFLPTDMESYGKSLAASLAFGSNILFWSEAGYFEKSALLKPLLHTWSLGVEEQFYIFFPLIALVLFKYFSKFAASIVVIGAVFSFLLNVIIIYQFDHHQTAFFMLPMRAWELLIGSILALGLIPSIQSKK